MRAIRVTGDVQAAAPVSFIASDRDDDTGRLHVVAVSLSIDDRIRRRLFWLWTAVRLVGASRVRRTSEMVRLSEWTALTVYRENNVAPATEAISSTQLIIRS
jgi:hypothetical protein